MVEESPEGIKHNTEEYNVNVLIDWQIIERILTVEYVYFSWSNLYGTVFRNILFWNSMLKVRGNIIEQKGPNYNFLFSPVVCMISRK